MTKMRAWSTEASKKLKEVEEQFPRLQYAMLSGASKGMISEVHSRSMNTVYPAMIEMLEPFTSSELQSLSKILSRHLHETQFRAARARHAKRARARDKESRAAVARRAATGADVVEDENMEAELARDMAFYNVVRQQAELKAESDVLSDENWKKAMEREKMRQNPKKYFPGLTPESLARATANRQARIRRVSDRHFKETRALEKGGEEAERALANRAARAKAGRTPAMIRTRQEERLRAAHRAPREQDEAARDPFRPIARVQRQRPAPIPPKHNRGFPPRKTKQTRGGSRNATDPFMDHFSTRR
jgi:hypothetical protein